MAKRGAGSIGPSADTIWLTSPRQDQASTATIARLTWRSRVAVRWVGPHRSDGGRTEGMLIPARSDAGTEPADRAGLRRTKHCASGRSRWAHLMNGRLTQ